jgi:tetratricopeptide (TPR) repeat protein
VTSSNVKMHYHQSMFRIRSRQSLVFAVAIAIACVLSSSASAQVVSSQIQDQVQEHFLAAQQAQQQGRLDDAVDDYKEVLRLEPGLPEVYANLGLVYYAQARFGDSAQALAMAGKLRPGMRGVSLWLGIDEVRLNHPSQGVTYLREAVRLDPQEKLAQSWLGTALWDAGQMDAALLQLRTASAQFPNDPDLLFAAGEAYGKAVHHQTEELLEISRGTALSDRIYADTYAEERDWTKAEGHLRRATERDPRSNEAQIDLAEVFFLQARFQDAKKELDQASDLMPRSAAVLARSGLVMILLDQPEEGLARIAKAIDIDRNVALDALGLPPDEEIAALADPESAIVRQCRRAATLLEPKRNDSPAHPAARAALLALAGDRDGAMRAYLSLPAGSHRAGGPETLYTQALDAMHAHRFGTSEDQFVRWLAAHPNDLTAQYDLLRVRRRLSLQQIDRLVAIAPDSYHVHQLLGELYADRDEDEKAISEYLAVAAARPDLPGIHFWLGHLYWKHGEADAALRELTRELQLDPLHPEANGELAAVLVAQGHPAEAIPHLMSAIGSKPDLWPAYAQLGRAYASDKNYSQAEAMLNKALGHDPDGSVHYQLGMVLRAEGKTAQAAQAFAEVRAIKNERMSAPSDQVADQGVHP